VVFPFEVNVCADVGGDANHDGALEVVYEVEADY